MSDVRTLLERAYADATPPPDGFERMLRRYDRKRRNQRVAAGVVGIAVFVAAAWIVTSGLAFDRTQTPAVPGGSETGALETAPPDPALASEQPDVARQMACSGDARSRLELAQVGLHSDQVWIRVRFEVHRSPAWHRWRVAIRPGGVGGPHPGSPIFRGIRVAGDSGQFAVQLHVVDDFGPQFPNPFVAKAVDTRTGQECKVGALIDP